MVFRVRTVPDPVAKVAGKIGGRIDKATLVAQMAVVADLENFDFDLRFEVVSFTVAATVGQFTREIPTTGARISDQQKQLLNGLARGANVYFQDIKARGQDGRIRDLPTVALKID